MRKSEFLGYDWRSYYGSVKAAEEDIGDFHYKGDGWYNTDQDSLFAEKVGELDDDGIWIYVWNIPNAQDKLRDISNMPVR